MIIVIIVTPRIILNTILITIIHINPKKPPHLRAFCIEMVQCLPPELTLDGAVQPLEGEASVLQVHCQDV